VKANGSPPSAGVEALTAAFPSLYGARVWLCLAVLALITAANMWGIAEAARIFMVPTIAFITAIFAVIAVGLARAHPAVALSHSMAPATDTVGVLLVLKAFASGCSALTGVEAIANSVPQFRKPRARRAQHTEVSLGLLLGLRWSRCSPSGCSSASRSPRSAWSATGTRSAGPASAAGR
jgi:amino acid transporter